MTTDHQITKAAPPPVHTSDVHYRELAEAALASPGEWFSTPVTKESKGTHNALYHAIAQAVGAEVRTVRGVAYVRFSAGWEIME